MKEFEGRYLGFSPTDESNVGLGEMELVIDENKIKTRLATGLEILEEEMDVSDFLPMTLEEIESSTGRKKPEKLEVKAFKHSSGYPELLFMKEEGSEFRVLQVRTDGLGEILGPTLLTNVDNGTEAFEDMLQKIESQDKKGCVPRLRNNGKAES